MRRGALVLAALVTLSACGPLDPVVERWLTERRESAQARGLPCAHHAALIELVGLPEHFHRVAERESTCWEGAVNPRSGATGLFQIMPGTWADDCGTTRAGLLDAFTNAVCAAHVLRVQGPDAWSQTW
jgi:hypothetical protein